VIRVDRAIDDDPDECCTRSHRGRSVKVSRLTDVTEKVGGTHGCPQPMHSSLPLEGAGEASDGAVRGRRVERAARC
jgi:hypothetical protein